MISLIHLSVYAYPADSGSGISILKNLRCFMVLSRSAVFGGFIVQCNFLPQFRCTKGHMYMTKTHFKVLVNLIWQFHRVSIPKRMNLAGLLPAKNSTAFGKLIWEMLIGTPLNFRMLRTS